MEKVHTVQGFIRTAPGPGCLPSPLGPRWTIVTPSQTSARRAELGPCLMHPIDCQGVKPSKGLFGVPVCSPASSSTSTFCCSSSENEADCLFQKARVRCWEVWRRSAPRVGWCVRIWAQAPIRRQVAALFRLHRAGCPNMCLPGVSFSGT